VAVAVAAVLVVAAAAAVVAVAAVAAAKEQTSVAIMFRFWKFRKRTKSTDLMAIWKRLQDFSLDEENAPYPFSLRLEEEQDWTSEFTARAIEEYKRFIFLAAFAGHQATPSFVTDEVWHLHLIYSRSYWDEMCIGILGRLIHHNPGSGLASQEQIFHGQYQKMLQSYRRFFDEPPALIWGPENAKQVRPKGRKCPLP
jgi:hypothetical protein